MNPRIGILFRAAMALMVAATVFVPVAAQAATCAMPSCAGGCCQTDGAMLSAGSMAIDTCCSVPGATMAPSTCPSGSQRPDFKAVSAVPEVLSPAVPLGAAFMVGPGLGKGSSLGGIADSARGPGDRLAGTRLRV